jgi:hypothetical protein
VVPIDLKFTFRDTAILLLTAVALLLFYTSTSANCSCCQRSPGC